MSLSISGAYDSSSQFTLSGELDRPSTSYPYYYLWFVDDSSSGYYWCVNKSTVVSTSSTTYSFSKTTSYNINRYVYILRTTQSNYNSYTVGNTYSSTPASLASASAYMQKYTENWFYYRYKFKLSDGTDVSESTSYYETSQNDFATINYSDIPTITGYSKLGTYIAIQNASLNPTYQYVKITGTEDTDEGRSYIGVYVQKDTTTIYYKYRYLKSDGTTVSDSAIMHEDMATAYKDVTLSSIPTISGYTKLGTYTNVQYASINTTYGYARCTGTSSSAPSIIGVYVQKTQIAKYYYKGSASADTLNIVEGAAFSTCFGATNINAMKAKIAEVKTSQGGTWTYTDSHSGDNFNKALHDVLWNGINGLTGHGTMPTSLSAGATLGATWFLTLRNALNTAIDYENNR